MSSSRIIVKNLPKIVTKEKLQEHFSQIGQVTDVRLVHTPSGVFRRFAFIGYLDESQASNAVNYYNKTFMDSCKMEVELAKPHGDSNQPPPHPWSKSAKERKDGRRLEEKEKKAKKIHQEQDEQRLNQEVHKSKLSKYLGELYDMETDPEFAEFMALHKSKTVSKAWSNDDDLGTAIMTDITEKHKEGTESPMGECDSNQTKSRKKKMRKRENPEEESIISDSGIPDHTDEARTAKRRCKGQEDCNEDSPSVIKATGSGKSSDEATPTRTPYTLKMRGVPFKSKANKIRDFFHPIKLSDIRQVNDKNGKPTGIAYVDFHSEQDMLEGFKRNRDCIGRRYIELFKEEPRDKGAESHYNKPRPWEKKAEEMATVESISESGRLFIRNLSYSITEDDLCQLFEKYGPLSEVLLPMDKNTAKPIGFGFVTFMLPEDAVKAFTELDKQIFQGRLLHILPSKPPIGPSTKPLTQSATTGTSSYKKTKETAMKESSSSAHNWNTLFLGSNAVVDSMAARYDVEKSELLNPEIESSLAVRLALGETQLVIETREFLEAQGVLLDAFNQAKPKRSKKIFIMKNLAYGTTDKELWDLLEPLGAAPTRVILPPGGISALVEYSEASAAMKVFKQLAYTEFKDVPLYVEWAPTGVIKKRSDTDQDGSKTTTDEQTNTEPNPIDETPNDDPKSSKILVRNVPFEAKKKEVMQLFGTIGKLKNVRLPKKMGSSNEHRGFCFIEYMTKEDAKRAIDTLGRSTHLYGRRLVLEWAELEDSVSNVRKKTSRYFNNSSNDGGSVEDNVAKRRKTLKMKLLNTLENSED